MKTKYLITATACSMLCMAGVQDAQAQRVYKQGSAVVMDFGPDSGFPQAAVAFTPGQKVVTGYSNTTGPVAGNEVKEAINATIYKKLEVSPKDDALRIKWAEAYKFCTDKGTNWRLPTQREIMQMWIFRDALVDLGAAPFLPDIIYWSATERNSTSVMVISNIAASIYGKDARNTARCVRELP